MKEWSGDFTVNENPLLIENVRSDMTITVSFEIKKYTIRFEAGENGTLTDLSGTNDILEYTIAHGGSCTTVAAAGDDGYEFADWSAGFAGTGNPLTVSNVVEDMIVKAAFKPKPETSGGNEPGGGSDGGGCFISSISD